MRDEQRSVWFPLAYGRRSVLRVALGGAAAASGALLAACGGQSRSPTPSPVAIVLPTGVPAVQPTVAPASTIVSTASAAAPTANASPRVATSGNLPSPAPNVPDAYLAPPPPFRSVATVPGKGGKISITKASQRPPAVPHDQNQWWQELEKRAGATLDFTLVPLPQYTEKATALIAAGDIPDILLISPLSAPDQYKAVQ
jgi:hypothetical protein